MQNFLTYLQEAHDHLSDLMGLPRESITDDPEMYCAANTTYYLAR